ncbi:MAG: hypothetical protein WED00_11870 [Aquisalimonadaceae bacterium]
MVFVRLFLVVLATLHIGPVLGAPCEQDSTWWPCAATEIISSSAALQIPPSTELAVPPGMLTAMPLLPRTGAASAAEQPPRDLQSVSGERVPAPGMPGAIIALIFGAFGLLVVSRRAGVRKV